VIGNSILSSFSEKWCQHKKLLSGLKVLVWRFFIILFLVAA
jgi:hypothetical protein